MPLFYIKWLPRLQAKPGLIEVIFIIVWVDATGGGGGWGLQPMNVYVCEVQGVIKIALLFHPFTQSAPYA